MEGKEYAWFHVRIYKRTKRDRQLIQDVYDGPDAEQARKAFDSATRPRTVRAGTRCYVSGTQCWRDGGPFETHRMFRDWSETREL